MKNYLLLLAIVLTGFCTACEDEDDPIIQYEYFLEQDGIEMSYPNKDNYLRDWLKYQIEDFRREYDKTKSVRVSAEYPEVKLSAKDAEAAVIGTAANEELRRIKHEFNNYLNHHPGYTNGQPISITLRYYIQRPDKQSIKHGGAPHVEDIYKSDTYHFVYPRD